MDVGIRKLCVIARICIFLDVDPTCFQAIVDCLNELTISSKDSPPSLQVLPVLMMSINSLSTTNLNYLA